MIRFFSRSRFQKHRVTPDRSQSPNRLNPGFFPGLSLVTSPRSFGHLVPWSDRYSPPLLISADPTPPLSWPAVKELIGATSSPAVAHVGELGHLAAIRRDVAILAAIMSIRLQGAWERDTRREAALVATRPWPTVVKAAPMATEVAVLVGVGHINP